MSTVDTPPLLFDGPEDAPLRVALAHGAGAPVDDVFFESLVANLAKRGVRIARFEFPYMQKRRADGKRRAPDRLPVLKNTWRAVAAELGPEWAIGGKSMGGRIASLVADEIGARALVCLGYPFHPAGKPELAEKPERVGHLAELATPALIVQGTRDALGNAEEVSSYTLASGIQLFWLPDGDHSLKPRKRSGYTLEGHLDAAAEQIAGFLASL